MSINNPNKNTKNNYIYTANCTSQRSNNTSNIKTITKSYKNSNKNKKLKNSTPNLSQNEKISYFPSSIIANYSKSLYYYNKRKFIHTFLNIGKKLENNRIKLSHENEHNIKSTRYETLCNSLNDSLVIKKR